MARPPRDRGATPGATYFVTATAWQNRALFQSAQVAELLLETVFGYRRGGKFWVHEFVVMPNHIHLLLTPTHGTTIERAMQLVKGGFSYRAREILGRSEIWQRGYVDHRIRDSVDYERHRLYVHQNPIRRFLCESPEEYPYSSARPGFDLDPVPQGLKPL